MGKVTVKLTKKQIDTLPALPKELRLSKAQILSAVEQLPVDDKFVLRNRLNIELRNEEKRRREAFDVALREIRAEYQHISPEEVERDICGLSTAAARSPHPGRPQVAATTPVATPGISIVRDAAMQSGNGQPL